MSRTDDQRVLDILDAADQVAGVVKDGRKAWDQDRLRQLAVERLLEIIGESANALTDEFRAAYPDVPWRDVIGLRIVLTERAPRFVLNNEIFLNYPERAVVNRSGTGDWPAATRRTALARRRGQRVQD